MKKLLLLLMNTWMVMTASAVDLKHCRIVTATDDAPLVQKMATVLSEDIERVTDVRPTVTHTLGTEPVVVLATVEKVQTLCPDIQADELRGAWERYKLITRGKQLVIIGSDPRGLAYGAFHVSERIGVSPWWWFADVPVKHQATLDYAENYTSETPTIKYRGIFINDEDWGLKTWAARNYEKELNDIGPKTYDRVCELLLRLKANMLAPAMHSCTGAFYSHPESQQVAASWGIMITTSHCEPMLFNNAAKSEWDKAVDGEWNYLTNKETIWKKFDDRLRETAQYDNIYTTGMRGLHDEAMKGSKDPKVRARTLEQVFADQRQILETHKQKPATDIPQIFVPYKEALDIYDAGLRVPDDITLVWPDDNYGYMKRVSNADERQRKGRAGVYYHISYLGTPHDNLWIATTAPALMYEELKKAYDAGADRYWLLNVGDIKPMEIEMQHFFDMAWNLSAFTYENVNRYQPQWLASLFGKQHEKDFQQILDTYYQLAWQRKPEFMGYEMEWDSEENNRLHDSDFPAQPQGDTPSHQLRTQAGRLAAYKAISDRVDAIQRSLPEDLQPAFFEMLGYSVKSAYQMNLKFLMAQRNHETGSAEGARLSQLAFDSIQTLLTEYNTQLDGKWNQMLSQLPPGYRAKYQLMPTLVDSPTPDFRLPKSQQRTDYPNCVDLSQLNLTPSGTKTGKQKRAPKPPFRLIEGIGTDWLALQLGEPLDPAQDPSSLTSTHIDLPLTLDGKLGSSGSPRKTSSSSKSSSSSPSSPSPSSDSLRLCISVVPFWPVSTDRSNRFGVSLDGSAPIVCENQFEEWSLPWKLQVLENRKDFLITLPIDRTQPRHTLTLIIGDPGQIIQRITYQ